MMEPGLEPPLPEAQPFAHGEATKASDVSILLNSRGIFSGICLVHTPLGLCMCAGENML